MEKIRKETIPMLYDYHTHPSIYAAFANNKNISEIKDKHQAIQAISETIKAQANNNKVSVILGWQNRDYPLNEDDFKDKDISEHPIIVCSFGLHNYFFNSAAKNYLRKDYESIVATINNQDKVEENLSDIFVLLTKLSLLNKESILNYFEKIQNTGVWAVEDMLATKEFINISDTSGFSDRVKFWTTFNVFSKLSSAEQSKIKGIKAFADGAPSACTAAFQEEYLKGETKGLLIYQNKALKELLHKVNELGKAFAIHTIGDRAIDEAVTIISEMRKNLPNIPEFRVEHACYISKETAILAKKSGINLVMQPNFSYESKLFKDIIPEKYLKRNNPFRMLIDDVGYKPGRNLFFGSDGMPSGVSDDISHGIKGALTQSLFPDLDSQKLTLEEFVDGYCLKDTSLGQINISINEKDRQCDTEIVINS